MISPIRNIICNTSTYTRIFLMLVLILWNKRICGLNIFQFFIICLILSFFCQLLNELFYDLAINFFHIVLVPHLNPSFNLFFIILTRVCFFTLILLIALCLKLNKVYFQYTNVDEQIEKTSKFVIKNLLSMYVHLIVFETSLYQCYVDLSYGNSKVRFK